MARVLVNEIKDTRKNYLINGDMRISQRATLFTSITDNAYCLDRYIYKKSGAMVHSIAQDTDVPTFAQAGYLFQNSLLSTVTTIDTSIAAGDYAVIQQRIEGYNWANLAQKAFTLSFWVKSSQIGTYCVAFVNSGSDRSYVAEYTINSPSTWEYKTVAVPASPSSGTWNYGTGEGLRVHWTLAAGSTFQTVAGAWQTGNFFATANQVNATNTIVTSWAMTGACINEGSTAAKFRNFSNGSIQAEQLACERYYRKVTGTSGIGISATTVDQVVFFEPSMRATPTPQAPGNLQITDQFATDYNQSSPNVTTVGLTLTGGRVRCANFSGLSAQRYYSIESDSGTFLAFDAEL